jgi:hypothetical protein
MGSLFIRLFVICFISEGSVEHFRRTWSIRFLCVVTLFGVRGAYEHKRSRINPAGGGGRAHNGASEFGWALSYFLARTMFRTLS